MGNQGLSGKHAREYCQAYPEATSLMLARMLKRDFPLVYTTNEAARSVVRYYRGASGRRHLKQAINAKALVTRYKLPETDREPYQPFALPEGPARWLILADMHIPYYEPEILALALDYARIRGARCDGVLFLGDLIDCFSLSFWDRDPNRRSFAGELEMVSNVLDAIVKALKPKSVVWKHGNHERRLERYLIQHAPEIFEGHQDLFSFNTFLNLSERKIAVVSDLDIIHHHALNLFHGHEYGGAFFSPVNPARTAYLKAAECSVVGHQHKSSAHTDVTVRGRTITTWSLGCACDLHPPYRPQNKWNHGFAILHTGNRWRVENKRVVNGEVL